MTPFQSFAQQLKARFDELSQHELFYTHPSGDAVWDHYLAAFPAGTNPIFRQRTEHDCSCCRNFIRNIANVVAIVDGQIQTIWDDWASFAAPYDDVGDEMQALIKFHPITGLYRPEFKKFGNEHTFEAVEGGDPIKWNHFHAEVHERHFFGPNHASVAGEFNTSAAMFRRALEDLQAGAFATVIDLIEGNALYRGEEFLATVQKFQAWQNEFYTLRTVPERDLFIWTTAGDPAVRFRNTAIGTLVVDLSEGMELEMAVKAFEKKVAPENYKRPTAVITPAMVKQAMATIEALDLQPALERRFAKLSDISVNNVLWVDNSVQNQMKGGIEGLLMEAAVPRAHSKEIAEDISIEGFMADVVPRAKTMDVLVKNAHQGNFMSLTAPVNEAYNRLFKWNNDFAWSYDGNITDSAIRQAVQGKGGRVDGVFRFSHSWNYDKRNASLMDLHVFMPGNAHMCPTNVHDHYGNSERVGWNARRHFGSGGVQDVDYTQAAPVGYVPVENITFPDLAKLKDGQYICKIHNWNNRAPTEGGFRAEIEFGGQVFEYEVTRPLKHKEWVSVATATLKDGVFTIEHHLPCSSSSQQKWGISTEQYVRVNTLMFSPNYWDDQAVGNKHWFFLLDGCLNDTPARGIYNEYLHNDLNEHRKVFEVLGDKTKCQPTSEQLSGLGFSSTRGDQLVVQVTGDKLRKTYNVKF